MSPVLITLADCSWTLCFNVLDGGRSQVAKVRLVQKYCIKKWRRKRKGAFMWEKVEPSILFQELIFGIQKVVHWVTHKKSEFLPYQGSVHNQKNEGKDYTNILPCPSKSIWHVRINSSSLVFSPFISKFYGERRETEFSFLSSPSTS